MSKIVVITVTPAIDVTYRVNEQTLGETIRVNEVTRVPGGKGVNVAKVLTTLGHDVTLITPLGGSQGDWMTTELLAEGFTTSIVKNTGETRSTVTVVDGNSHPTLFSEPAPALDESTWKTLHNRLARHCVGANAVVLSGSVPTETRQDHISRVVEIARSSGALMVVDTSGPTMLTVADAGADVITPNADELAIATGEADILSGIASLSSRGGSTVVVTAGPDGIVTVVDGAVLRTAAVTVPAVNPTGAGDAATAGLVDALANNVPLPHALERAAVLGSAAVMQPIAGVVDLSDISRLTELQADAENQVTPATSSDNH